MKKKYSKLLWFTNLLLLFCLFACDKPTPIAGTTWKSDLFLAYYDMPNIDPEYDDIKISIKGNVTVSFKENGMALIKAELDIEEVQSHVSYKLTFEEDATYTYKSKTVTLDLNLKKLRYEDYWTGKVEENTLTFRYLFGVAVKFTRQPN